MSKTVSHFLNITRTKGEIHQKHTEVLEYKKTQMQPPHDKKVHTCMGLCEPCDIFYSNVELGVLKEAACCGVGHFNTVFT